MKGRIMRIHTMRDSANPKASFAQCWVVEDPKGKQYLLSVKLDQEIEFTKRKDTYDRIASIKLRKEDD